MSAAPNTGSSAERRWALSPIDSCSHLLAERGVVPRSGCWWWNAGSSCRARWTPVPTRSPGFDARPTHGVQARPVSQLLVSGTESVPDLGPELVASLALRRARDGGVSKVGDCYSIAVT
ncbi:MAG: hypothetical protein ACRDTJ_03615 [Pseudonocardiaceae bacterium]